MALNGRAEATAEIARDKAPRRKVFSGGRQTVRFKTAAEVEGDRELRARLGLGPEKVATREGVAQLIRAGLDPFGRKGFPNAKLPGGEPFGREEFGYATTIEHAGRTHTGGPTKWRSESYNQRTGKLTSSTGPRKTDYSGRTHTDRPRNLRNKLNAGEAGSLRAVGRSGKTGMDYRKLKYAAAESFLNARGRYELKSGRALSSIARVGGGTVGIHEDDTARLGGSLIESIHVVPASADQYPVISASVVAGGGRVTYAKFQELGTRHNPAHPFLRPALAVAQDKLPGDLERALKRVLGGSRR